MQVLSRAEKTIRPQTQEAASEQTSCCDKVSDCAARTFAGVVGAAPFLIGALFMDKSDLIHKLIVPVGLAIMLNGALSETKKDSFLNGTLIGGALGVTLLVSGIR